MNRRALLLFSAGLLQKVFFFFIPHCPLVQTPSVSKQCKVLFPQLFFATIEFGASIFWFWVTVEVFV